MPLNPLSQRLQPVDSLTIDVITDDVSDAYISKTIFAVSEFANIVKGGAKEISGETLLLANLGLGADVLVRIVRAAFGATGEAGDWPRDRVAGLVAERYASEDWNRRL